MPESEFAMRDARNGLIHLYLPLCVCGLIFVPLAAGVGAAPADKPWARHTIDNSSKGADGVRLADLNGDGLMDIATGWEEGGVIRAYLNPGHKKAKDKWPAVTVGRVKSAEDAVFADLDGDGSLDVVSSCEGGTKTIFVHWAPKEKEKYLDPKAWKTQPFEATRKKQAWMYALPMDVDGQNGIDLIVGSKGKNARVGWLQSPEDPRKVSAWKYHRIENAGWIMSLEPADMDGDGDTDVVASDRKGPTSGVYWLENPGPAANTRGAKWTRHDVGASGREVMFLQVVKQNAGNTSAILAAVKPYTIMVWTRRPSRADFRLMETSYPAEPYGTAKAVHAADLDADGSLELVVTCERAKGKKSGLFAIPWQQGNNGAGEAGIVARRDRNIGGPVGVKYDRIEMLDLDGDGDPDVLTCEERDLNAVVWYENPAK